MFKRREILITATEKASPVIEAIKSRRAVRSYESKPIPREIVEEIIDAGNRGCGMSDWYRKRGVDNIGTGGGIGSDGPDGRRSNIGGDQRRVGLKGRRRRKRALKQVLAAESNPR